MSASAVHIDRRELQAEVNLISTILAPALVSRNGNFNINATS